MYIFLVDNVVKQKQPNAQDGFVFTEYRLAMVVKINTRNHQYRLLRGVLLAVLLMLCLH